MASRSGFVPPTGATIEPDGYATILKAPPAPYRPPPRAIPCWEQPLPTGEARVTTDDFEVLDYRCMRGISLAQARAEIQQLRADAAEAQAVRAKLQRNVPDNFVELSIQRVPVAAWKFTFKRDPEATLRRHTSNPRFIAAMAIYTPAEQEALRKALWPRLEPYVAFSGAGADGISFGMKITEAEFRALPQFRDFVPLPGVTLDFPKEPEGLSITPDAAPFVRILPQQRYFPGIILTGGISYSNARIILRNGCLYFGNALVRLNRTMQLFRDAQGYLALRDRNDPLEPAVRIGEQIANGGGYSEPVSDTDRALIARQCGDHPIVDLYSPDSKVNWNKWIASRRSDAVPVPPER